MAGQGQGKYSTIAEVRDLGNEEINSNNIDISLSHVA